ncbi:hypothetical protein Agsp01_02430 [Agromyces sp. NBRC 114283]|nr:hypothetical protein Agsp01_02430 [Agromyces sp. NBRC 114283]
MAWVSAVTACIRVGSTASAGGVDPASVVLLLGESAAVPMCVLSMASASLNRRPAARNFYA